MQEPNYTVIEDLFKSILETLKRKNHDYDNTYVEMYDECGKPYSVSKIIEKVKRIKKLSSTDAQVPGEGLIDAIVDSIGYHALYYERLITQHHGTTET